jgi:hypothetical protein
MAINEGVPCRVSAETRIHEREEERRWQEEEQRREEAEFEATSKAAQDIKDADWWAERLEGIDPSKEAAATLARCMTNLDAACTGDAISVTAILTALSNLQKQAKRDAYDWNIEL